MKAVQIASLCFAVLACMLASIALYDVKLFIPEYLVVVKLQSRAITDIAHELVGSREPIAAELDLVPVCGPDPEPVCCAVTPSPKAEARGK